MKKLTFVLGFLFVAAMAMSTYATNEVLEKNSNITIVDLDNDKKPCPKDCKKECCADKKAESKVAKADCNKKAECGPVSKSCCSSSKATSKTDKKTKTTTEKK